MLSSLRVRLLLLILFAVLPALGLILYSAMETRQDAIEEVRQDAGELAQSAVLHQKELTEGARHVLVFVASLTRASDLAGIDPESCRRAFSGLLSSLPLYANFGIVLPNGELACSAVPPEDAVNLADRSWFKQALRTGGLAFGEYQIGRITGEPTMNIGYPITGW